MDNNELLGSLWVLWAVALHFWGQGMYIFAQVHNYPEPPSGTQIYSLPDQRSAGGKSLEPHLQHVSNVAGDSDSNLART